VLQRRWLWTLFPLGALACSNSDGDTSPIETPAADAAGGRDAGIDVEPETSLSCEPGEQQPCSCSGGVQGSHRCRDDGAGWEGCQCPDASLDAPTDAPDAPDAIQDGAADTAVPDSGSECQPAPCIPQGEMGWNCDPACGTVDPECATMCDNSSTPIELDFGVYYLRTAPNDEQLCCSAGGPKSTWRFRFASNYVCGDVIGPYGLGYSTFTSKDSGYDPCDEQPSVGWGWYSFTPGPDPLTVFMSMGVFEKDPGSLVRIDVADPTGSCPSPVTGHCNGYAP